MVLTHKKGRRSKRIAKSVFFERKTGLEPATLTLARLCSTNWATSASLQDRACSGFLLKTMQRYKLFSNPPNLPSGRHGNYIKIAKGLIVVERRRRALQGRYPFIAQGASPGLIIETYLLSPKGAALPRRKCKCSRCSAAPCWSSSSFSSVCTQSFISGFALISPWAMQECRPKGLLYDKILINHLVILKRETCVASAVWCDSLILFVFL